MKAKSIVGGICFFLLMFPEVQLAQNIYINEIMAKNKTVLQDADGDYSDWIELFNGGIDEVEMEGFWLSDEREHLKKWKFPSTTILPGGFLLVFASGKDRIDPMELHTDFKISSDGEAVFLSNSDLVVLDSFPAVKLEDDESFGNIRENIQTLRILTTPSPNGANIFKDCIEFSKTGGFYENPFWLKTNSLLADSIFCTLDGSIPDTNSLLITDSILMGFRNSHPNRLTDIPTSVDGSDITYHAWEKPAVTVDKATIIRCASFENKKQLSEVFSMTYFVDSSGFEKYDLPVISLITEEENFFDEETGIYVPGDNFDENNPEWSGNYFESGRDWERSVHIEFFENDGTLAFSQDAGVRTHGGKTRHAAQKTLKFYARKEYGEKHFDYQLLPDKSIDQYRQFLLRTTMGAWGGPSVIKDVLCAEIVRDFNMEIQGHQPAVVFMNGEYWGIHTIRERPNEWFPAMIYDLEVDSVGIVVNQNFESTVTGSFVDFNSLLDFIAQNDISKTDNYEYVKSEIDIESYMDYYIAETFFANYDWPGNNMKQWRYGKNGKWRYIFYDLDGGMRAIDYNMFEHATESNSNITWPNPPQSTFLFINLLKNEEFKTRFIEKYKIALETTFHPDNSRQILREIKNQYTREMPRHIERWNFPETMEVWEETVSTGLDHFLSFRPCIVVEQIKDFFNISDFEVNCMPAGVDITEEINNAGSMVIAPNPTNGSTFLINNSKEVLKGNLSVLSLLGQPVYEKKAIEISRNESITLDLKNLSKGAYFVDFSENGVRHMIKLLIIE